MTSLLDLLGASSLLFVCVSLEELGVRRGVTPFFLWFEGIEYQEKNPLLVQYSIIDTRNVSSPPLGVPRDRLWGRD